MTAEEFFNEKYPKSKLNIDWMQTYADYKKCMVAFAEEYANQKQVSDDEIERYAEFCIRCDREGLNPIIFNDWKHKLTNK